MHPSTFSIPPSLSAEARHPNVYHRLLRVVGRWPHGGLAIPREPHKEPSPAQSASAVILATGAMAVVEVAGHARSAHDYVVALCIGS